MLKVYTLIFLIQGLMAYSQEKLGNSSAIRIFEEEGIGIHIPMVNNGTFKADAGLVGFYSSEPLSIQGADFLLLQNVEVMTDMGLFVSAPVKIDKSLNMISGNIITTLSEMEPKIFLNSEVVLNGFEDTSKIIGYVSSSGSSILTYPVGDMEQYRPISIETQDISQSVKVAYHYTLPYWMDLESSLGTTGVKNSSEQLAGLGFWHVASDSPVQIHIPISDAFLSLISNTDEMIVAGWNTATETWDDLTIEWEDTGGGSSIVSQYFGTNQHPIITVAYVTNKKSLLEPNTLVTANEDGKNDELYFSGLDQFGHNHLQIFDRYGVVVFEMNNYNNGFKGFSNRKMTIKNSTKLPDGVYFYVLNTEKEPFTKHGYFYLSH